MLSLAVLALASLVSSANGLVIPRLDAPADYDADHLEQYATYHARYIALDCEDKHATSFFDACCHPMLATENLADNRAAECSPSSNAVTPPVNVASPSSSAYPLKSSSSTAAAPAPSSSSTDLITGGIATFFFQNGVAGSCGTVHKDNDFVVALSTEYDNSNKYCGKKILLIDANTGHQETAVVADSCPTCKNSESVDLSYQLFLRFATEAAGVFDLKWKILDP